MNITDGIFARSELLLGHEALDKIKQTKVIIFGVGGVGSWCAESLIRSGIGELTIVDSDNVCVTNINRQLMATTKTIGQVKVEVLKNRLLEINPNARINSLQQIFSLETLEDFNIERYDYIIDAIDSLQNKADLIESATKASVTLFSSMGAARKSDPTRIRISDFWKVQGCPLAAALRRKLRSNKKNIKFQCVYSDELLENKGADSFNEDIINTDANGGNGKADTLDYSQMSRKVQVNGTLAHVTAIFGFNLAGLVIQDICS